MRGGGRLFFSGKGCGMSSGGGDFLEGREGGIFSTDDKTNYPVYPRRIGIPDCFPHHL